jgi:hypothetical protein
LEIFTFFHEVPGTWQFLFEVLGGLPGFALVKNNGSNGIRTSQPMVHKKKVLKCSKNLFLFSVSDLSSLSINILQNFNCYLNKMDIEQTRPNT